jgi:hypothetical protein
VSADDPFAEKRARELLQFFDYEHLPPHLQAMSKPFGEAAHRLMALSREDLRRAGAHIEEPTSGVLYRLRSTLNGGLLPCNTEATWAEVKITEAQATAAAGAPHDMVLRRLLEAKDCAVRSLVFKWAV